MKNNSYPDVDMVGETKLLFNKFLRFMGGLILFILGSITCVFSFITFAWVLGYQLRPGGSSPQVDMGAILLLGGLFIAFECVGAFLIRLACRTVPLTKGTG